MHTPQPEHDLLSQIPSPSRRLWIGLCIILSIFVVFAVYAIHEIRWLEDFQVNVVTIPDDATQWGRSCSGES